MPSSLRTNLQDYGRTPGASESKLKLNQLGKQIRKALKSFNEKKYLSFGENCLTDDILARYGLKSFSSPFAAARSNVEYILQIQKDDYKDFLNPCHLEYGYVGQLRVVRLKQYGELLNRYDASCMNGFEFTHHDVIADEKARADLERRVRRMQSLEKCTLVMFYHHRFCPETDMGLLIKNLNDLKQVYRKTARRVHLVAFTQKLVSEERERRVEKRYLNGIHFYCFYTLNIWAGDDQDIFWARCDDDLIRQMISDVKKL